MFDISFLLAVSPSGFLRKCKDIEPSEFTQGDRNEETFRSFVDPNSGTPFLATCWKIPLSMKSPSYVCLMLGPGSSSSFSN